MPHRQLKHVQPLDFQAAELVDRLNSLGSQRVCDHVVDGPSVRVAELGCDLVVGKAGRPELYRPDPAGGNQGPVPVLSIDLGKFGSSSGHTTMMTHSPDKAAKWTRSVLPALDCHTNEW